VQLSLSKLLSAGGSALLLNGEREPREESRSAAKRGDLLAGAGRGQQAGWVVEDAGSKKKRRLRTHRLWGWGNRGDTFKSRRGKIQMRKQYKWKLSYDSCRGRERKREEQSEDLQEGGEYFKVFPCHEPLRKQQVTGG